MIKFRLYNQQDQPAPESIFKAGGLVMRRAVSYDSARVNQLLSTKGVPL